MRLKRKTTSYGSWLAMILSGGLMACSDAALMEANTKSTTQADSAGLAASADANASASKAPAIATDGNAANSTVADQAKDPLTIKKTMNVLPIDDKDVTITVTKTAPDAAPTGTPGPDSTGGPTPANTQPTLGTNPDTAPGKNPPSPLQTITFHAGKAGNQQIPNLCNNGSPTYLKVTMSAPGVKAQPKLLGASISFDPATCILTEVLTMGKQGDKFDFSCPNSQVYINGKPLASNK